MDHSAGPTLTLPPRRKKVRFGVQTRILLILLLVMSASLVGFSVLVLPLIQQSQLKSFRDKARDTSRVLAAGVSREWGGLAEDIHVFKRFPGKALNSLQVRNMAILGPGGAYVIPAFPDQAGARELLTEDSVAIRNRAQTDAMVFPLEDRAGRILRVWIPLESRVAQGAWLRVDYPLDTITRQVAETQRYLIYSVLTMVGGLMVMAWFLFGRLIVSSVRSLDEAVRQVSGGDYRARVRIAGQHEFSRLGEAFNSMAESIGHDRARIHEQVRKLEELNDSLKRTQDELIRSEKLALVGRMGAGVAHEIGNPLAAVLGYVQMLRASQLDEETRKDFLARIEGELKRIEKILRDLLQYSRPRETVLEPVPVAASARKAIDLLRPQARYKHIRFSVENPDGELYVQGDQARLMQVLFNLLINAADSMGDQGEAAIRVNARDAFVVIEVSDTGPGIPEHAIHSIFEPFFSTKEAGAGTGLGLWICQSIISSMNGTISANNLPDGGACFRIELPRLAMGMAPFQEA
ncbi:MAG: Adaptive-response sensory-kinase SasA [Myxococcota bacterium]|nr:Adaptive-response sensory-kinase SasA [Myxococcota bacterium]